MRSFRWILAPALGLLLSVFCSDVLHAQRFSFEALTGDAYNIPTPLTVSQTGYPDLRFNAHYDTKPFGPYYPYYSWRFTVWNREQDQGWELTQVHHRIFLTNNPPEIQTFAIHFGYNFYMLGHVWKRGNLVYHVDGGVLICNPESTVRGQKLQTKGMGLFDAGYTLSGGGAQAGVSRTFDLAKHVFVTANGALMAGRARVAVANGSAAVPNVSLHGRLGVGYRF